MLVPEKPVVYYAVFFETFYDSVEDAVSSELSLHSIGFSGTILVVV